MADSKTNRRRPMAGDDSDGWASRGVGNFQFTFSCSSMQCVESPVGAAASWRDGVS